MMLDKVNEIFNVTMEDKGNETVILEMYATPEYFVVGDSIEAAYGRLGKRLIRFISRQALLEGVEKNLRQVYHVPFIGEVLEDDGKKLKIGCS